MISLLVRTTVVLALAWTIVALLRHRSAALRHAVWMVALVACLLMPAAEWAIPKHVIRSNAVLVYTPPVFVRANGSQSFLPAAPWMLLTWAAGLFALLARSAVAHRKASLLASNVTPSGEFQTIPIGVSQEVRGPAVIGILRNTILLPAESDAWPADTRRSVLAHEAEHVRRHDGLTLAIGELIRAIYWFHPLIWLALSQLRKEAEKSCDDAAIRLGLRPSSYAGLLLKLARAFPSQPALASSWMPMATTSHLENRMKAILDPHPNRSAARRGTWFGAALLGAVLLLSLSSISLQAQDASKKPIRVGGNVAQANLITKVSPQYPAAAKERRAQGVVKLAVRITKEGVPEDIQAEPSDVDGELIGAAIDAVRQWRYKPTLLNGEPVEVLTTIDINFTLLP